MDKDDLAAFSLRKVPRQRRSQATVDAILEAAARILVADGYVAATTNRIAEVAGVSVGSLYEYFPGKEAIFAEVMRRESLKHYDMVMAEPRPTEPRAVLRHLISTRIEWVRDNLALYVALVREVPRDALAETDRKIVEDYMVISVGFLETNRARLRPAIDARLLSEILMSTVSATIGEFALRFPHRLAQPELTEELVQMVDGYLLLSTT